MDPSQFSNLVSNFTTLDEREADEISRLAKQHPYCQVLHALEARASHDLRRDDNAQVLHTSAVYATDRAILKWVMTAPRQPRALVTSPEVAAPLESAGDAVIAPIVPERTPSPERPTEDGLTGDELRDDLKRELERLQRLKHDFELSVEAFESGKPMPAPTPEPAAPARKKKARTAAEPAPEVLLEEIKSTRKKSHPETPRQKEQNEIIDQFIREKPTIPKPKVATPPAQDLAEESGAFTDNIISETLVDILLRQGKKDKALEVLRKLIWKFPQKKAYFAAQIEKLKS